MSPSYWYVSTAMSIALGVSIVANGMWWGVLFLPLAGFAFVRARRRRDLQRASGKGRDVWAALAGFAAFASVVLWLLSLAGASFACAGENVPCVRHGSFTSYRGRVFDYEGRPASHAVLLFTSPVDRNRSEERVVTDVRGRFCVRTLQVDQRLVSLTVAGQRGMQDLVVRSNAPVDARFADPTVRASLRRLGSSYIGPSYEPFMTIAPDSAGSFYPGGAHPAVTLWNPVTDSAYSCQGVRTQGPWYRVEDVRMSWQFAALTAASLLTLAILFIGFLARSGNFGRLNRWANTPERAYQAVVAAAALNLAVFLTLWPVF